MEDVWSYIDKLQAEAMSLGETNTVKTIFAQLPFFTCLNFFYCPKSQKDISKYLYCSDTGTPPFSGGYSNTTNIWKEKHFLIKQALSILYQDKKEELTRKQNHGR
tara:strand:+ start:817 stop:1131 length:315 start_codon:yes stop_codon:yes gene_type:complete